MATDGDIDFKTYTREQLDSAVTRIDRQRYPINARNLIAEYQQRRVAERQAVELAVESATVAPPDRMLSASRSFAVTFEPTANLTNWMGPSRNDFHLVGSGTIRVDDALVRVTGRRFGVFIGLPIVDTDELGRQFVVNVEAQGPVVRFELRVPGEKVRGLTVWLRTAEEADGLSKLLPLERTPDFTPQLARHVEFEQSLIAQSPKTPVTYGLVILCVCVYVTTAFGTNHVFGFDGRSLISVGSNFGPYTTDGDWWRLLTSMFLHAGIIHLAFNMWALASFGPVVERLYGSASYALIYLVAGIAGSLASVSWSPAINSVGASGAIFGLLGALIATQMRSDGSIPISELRPLRNSSLIFTGCALSAGLLSTGVDNAAHLGGVATGFILGLVLSRPITGMRLRTGAFFGRFGLAALVGILLLGAGVSTAKYSSKRLTGEWLYAATLHWFMPGEVSALQRYRELAALARAGKWDGKAYANRIEREVIPFWSEADARLAKLDLPITSDSYESCQWWRSVIHDRLHAYQLTVQALRQNDNKIALQAGEELQRVDDQVHERAKARAAQR
jgi:membrane associated rhomboid family serine protease